MTLKQKKIYSVILVIILLIIISIYAPTIAILLLGGITTVTISIMIVLGLYGISKYIDWLRNAKE